MPVKSENEIPTKIFCGNQCTIEFDSSTGFLVPRVSLEFLLDYKRVLKRNRTKNSTTEYHDKSLLKLKAIPASQMIVKCLAGFYLKYKSAANHLRHTLHMF